MLWKKESNATDSMFVDLFHGQEVRMPYILRKLSKIDDENEKNDGISHALRRSANEMFEESRFIDAMQGYNKSLCFAKDFRPNWNLGYMNRAACFLKLKMYKKCIADIDLAMKNESLRLEVLQEFEEKKNDCQKLMETEVDQSDASAAKLDFEANEQFSCLANVVDIESSDEFGHRIVATADIEIGKTVMVEQCYIGVTKIGSPKACNICLKEVQNFVPCKKCVGAMFCSGCENNNLHEIECKINIGYSDECELEFMDVVRSISMAKNAFTTAEELIVFVEDMLKSATVQPINLMDEQSKYRAFFQSCPDWKTYGLRLEQTFLYYQLLLDQEEMAAFFHTDAHRRFLMHLVQHHMFMIIHGAFKKRFSPEDGVNITETYINIVAKHLNHSCIPNVCHVLNGGSISCITIRPIKKGEELFISYVTLNDFESEPQRAAALKQKKVNCKCIRCELKPLPSDHQMKSDLIFKLIERMFENQKFRDDLYERKQIDVMKEKCFNFMQKYGQQECSAEMYRVIDVLYLLLSK